MRRIAVVATLLLLALAGRAAQPSVARDVYVLKSSGICDGCAEAICRMLISAGVRSQIVGPEQLKKLVRPQDVLIIGGSDPDGEGELEIQRDLIKVDAFEWLKQHIEKGGRYIGICAGAYLAEKWIDKDKGERGLDIFPGVIKNLSKDKSDRLLQTHWAAQNVDRWVYFQDGPLMIPNKDASVTVMATFVKGGQPAALVYSRGLGKVGLISPHLEASEDWFRDADLKAIDGLSYDLGLSVFKAVVADNGAETR